jgi:hypothetical protein
LFGTINEILIAKEEVFVILKVDYKIIQKKNQFYKLQKLDKELFYLRNMKKLESKVIFCENGSQFVIPPNIVECD